MIRWGNWLPDAWFSEMCVETRDEKGWHNPRNFRNEAWDLTYYAIGLCVSVSLRTEGIDWTNPPGWAAPWDRNDMVFKPEVTSSRFAPASKAAAAVDFSEFGKKLG
jgi:phage terminase large subunit GpA-like protein